LQNIDQEVQALIAKGVDFQRHPGMTQRHLGVWTAPGEQKPLGFSTAMVMFSHCRNTLKVSRRALASAGAGSP
jgi:hypothetical protein